MTGQHRRAGAVPPGHWRVRPPRRCPRGHVSCSAPGTRPDLVGAAAVAHCLPPIARLRERRCAEARLSPAIWLLCNVPAVGLFTQRLRASSIKVAAAARAQAIGDVSLREVASGTCRSRPRRNRVWARRRCRVPRATSRWPRRRRCGTDIRGRPALVLRGSNSAWHISQRSLLRLSRTAKFSRCWSTNWPP